MKNIHEDIEEYNPNKIQKTDHIIFDDMIDDIISNKKSNSQWLIY